MIFLYIFLGLIFFAFTVLLIQNLTPPSGIGVKDGKLKGKPFTPNAVSSQFSDPKFAVKPLPFKGDLKTSRDKILEILKTSELVKIKKEESNYIYAVFQTPKAKFNDDVEFYFDESQKVIHFRSASRAGFGDKGVNKRRYLDIVKKYGV
ncbi:MAG: DUF1499 domain-containing protein [Leptospiraceae bacterium]|nr:DUF1499 domain-containing protein [Leptospiraceae bacterium]